VENGKMRHLAESRSFSSITADGDSCLWIASKFGNVYQMAMNPPFELKDDTIAGNLNGDEVLKVRADNKGRLWILSAGIVKEYNTKTKGCRIATTQQLKTGTFTDFFLENDGIRIIGTEGETRLKETESLGKDKGIRNICVSAYTIDGQHFLTTANELPIDSKCKALTLFLTAFVFDTPADITFSYRIDNGEWVDMEKGDNSISFSQIPYGNSNVQVKARDAYGQWSDTFNVITISHPRPWYSHLWIPALIAILAGGLWAYNKRKRIQKQQLADRIRKYEAEKDELTLKLQEAERKAEEMGYEKEDTDSEYATLSAADRQLMEKAKGFVTNNLTNVEYGVDELSSDLCMSRNNLYRKMKAIIGKSPTDFIRDIRLEHAAMLLSTSSYSVNEISDLTGFSYPSYFTKCFKDKYGKSPKEYRN
jgi:AraC-like DNA-binding protein